MDWVRWRLRWIGALALLPGLAAGGAAVQAQAFAPAAAGLASRTVTGQVVDSASGSPVPRALVRLNARMVLTDAQGRFSFAGFADAQAYLSATKPGYSQMADATVGSQQERVADLDAAQRVVLYPDALITGTVTAQDGSPLSRIPVRLSRLIYDQNGARWIMAAGVTTDLHGRYRFRQPAGRFRLSTMYIQELPDRKEAVLPVLYPAGASSSLAHFRLAPGAVQQIDLRPRTGVPAVAELQLSSGSEAHGVGLIATTSAGISFRLPSFTSEPGVLRLQLPAGVYTVRAVTGERNQNSFAETRLTVSAEQIHRAPLQMVPVTEVPVEVVFDSAADAQTLSLPLPPARQLNLIFHSTTSDGSNGDDDSRIDERGNQQSSFQLMPGRYRLQAAASGWFVTSAQSGATNLLSDDLVIAAGSAGAMIRIAVSRTSGTIRGKVASTSPVAGDWVYLVPLEPNVTPFYASVIQPDGSYNFTALPGRYSVLAVDHALHENFRDGDFLQRFAAAGTAVTLTAGSPIQVDLPLTPGPGDTP